MRIVLDTNVFISGIFLKGNFCSQLIDKWKKKEIELISSLEIVEELIKILRSFKIQMPEDLIEEWKNFILNNSTIIKSSSKIDVIKEDPDDNKFIEAGFYGKADFIISQDKHLLKLEKYQGIRIISPKEIITLL